MKTLWLTVEDCFAARGRGVILEPKFVPPSIPKGNFSVIVRSNDGSEKEFQATLDVAHSRGNLPPFAMIRLLNAEPDEIAKGSQVWVIKG